MLQAGRHSRLLEALSGPVLAEALDSETHVQFTMVTECARPAKEDPAHNVWFRCCLNTFGLLNRTPQTGGLSTTDVYSPRPWRRDA